MEVRSERVNIELGFVGKFPDLTVACWEQEQGGVYSRNRKPSLVGLVCNNAETVWAVGWRDCIHDYQHPQPYEVE